jgi:hypothetical protein
MSDLRDLQRDANFGPQSYWSVYDWMASENKIGRDWLYP